MSRGDKINAIVQAMLDAFMEQTERDPMDGNMFDSDGHQLTIQGEFDGGAIAEAILDELERG